MSDPTKHHASLECPECDNICKPYRESKDGSAYYRCKNIEGHADSSDLKFKIDGDGNLLY